MLNIRRFQNGLQIVPRPDGATATSQQGELAVSSADGNLYYNNGSTASPILTSSQSGTISNKTIIVDSTVFADGTDNTKTLNFNLSGDTTGTHTTLDFVQTANRVITFPDASGFLVLSGSSGIITGNLLDESSVWFVDHTDTTKAFKFASSTSTTGTSTTLLAAQTANRVLTLPDLTDNLVSRTSTDTLTNKTLTSPVINTATADTITGIGGSPLTIQSASGQNLVLTAQGAGNTNITGTVVNIQDLAITNDNISGASTADLTIQTLNNKNLQLSPNGTGTIVANSPLNLIKSLDLTRADDSTTTGTATTLAAFTTSYVKVTNASLVSLSAIPAGTNGQILVLSNGTGASFLINDEDAGVTAANRIRTGTGFPITLSNNSSVSVIYDTGSSRWKVFGGAGGGTPPTTFGTRASPRLVSTSINATDGHMSTTALDQVIFVTGNGLGFVIAANPAIQAGTIVGQRMQIIGRSNTNTLGIPNQTGAVELNGSETLGLSDVITLVFDGTAWVEISRNN